ncbi:MAG: transporter substrate-binding domain-containing protein [Bacteriovoracaceae bacterium]|nr:transporter substrate-binding domain-containing protein [Bacteriovoracaceae bacterium]
MRKIILVFITAFCCLNQQSICEDTIKTITGNKILRVGLEVGHIPFSMFNNQGQAFGFDIELAKLMAKKLKVGLEIINTQWSGIIPGLLASEFDISIASMSITPGRNILVNFSKPYLISGQTLLIKSSLQQSVYSFADLNSKKYIIGFKSSSEGEKAAKKMINKEVRYKSFKTLMAGANEVRSGKIDAFIADHSFNSYFAQKYSGKVHFLANTFTYAPLAIAVRKDDPNILNWINNFLDAIKKSGEFKKLHDSWLVDTSWSARLPLGM